MAIVRVEFPLTPPRAWSVTEQPAKYPVKMRLIREAALRGDPSERGIGRHHQRLRSLHSPPHNVSVWSIREAFLERATEMGRAQSNDRSELPISNRSGKIALDIPRYPPFLTGRQAAHEQLRAPLARLTELLDHLREQWVCPEDGARTLHTLSRRSVLILKSIAHGLPNRHHRKAQLIPRNLCAQAFVRTPACILTPCGERAVTPPRAQCT